MLKFPLELMDLRTVRNTDVFAYADFIFVSLLDKCHSLYGTNIEDQNKKDFSYVVRTVKLLFRDYRVVWVDKKGSPHTKIATLPETTKAGYSLEYSLTSHGDVSWTVRLIDSQKIICSGIFPPWEKLC